MKKYITISIVIVIVLGGYLGVNAIFSTDIEIPTANASKGEFVISLKSNGTVDATRAMSLSTPRVRGLQITWLAPEGTTVAEGDPVIKFDASKQQTDLLDQQSDLKIKTSALQRARQEYIIQEKQLRLDLEKSRRNYDEKKHEAPRVAEEAKLELELSELNFEAKLDQLTADVEKAEVEVQRAKDKVNQGQKELDMMSINAPIPGLVVYLEIWKGGTMSKVQEGDSPWPGQGLVNLPDLSEMMVKTSVSEVDANKVDSGQAVEVVLDAFPNVIYTGEVRKKGTLARKKEPNSKINVFDVEVTILEDDDKLKPGMSASCDIIVDRIPDIVSVPLEAVFERDGETVVYLKNKKRREVEVGLRNDMSIQILDGLEGDEEVCLVDPSLDEQGLPGDRASEPELNKGRTAPEPDKTSKQGRGSGKGSGGKGGR
ncbi:MAG: efflux RND transporter periplasmic adaptor subunit [bacterium]|nr:efflux RND transporter periplasmic adaptor subunit [bacterium]